MLISLKFVPNGQIDNNSALFQVMAWRRTGEMPLSEAMLSHIIEILTSQLEIPVDMLC